MSSDGNVGWGQHASRQLAFLASPPLMLPPCLLPAAAIGPGWHGRPAGWLLASWFNVDHIIPDCRLLALAIAVAGQHAGSQHRDNIPQCFHSFG